MSVLRQMWQDLFKSHVQLASFLLRVGLAVIFIFRGYIMLSVEGGRAWTDDLPEGTQMVVAWGEMVCGCAMLVGLLSRLAAVGLIVIMVGAIVVQTGQFGLVYTEYLKTNPGRVPTGAEYNVAVIVMCLAILALGSGMVSLDYLLFGRRRHAVGTHEPAASRGMASPRV